MGAKTGISWTDATWNPIRGCSMALGSETKGCLNCYAARLNARGLPGLMSPTTGKPLARILESGPRWTGDVELIEKNLKLPMKWRQPKRIFVNSMSDLFHEALSDEQIDRVFAVMALCPQHTFQVLTKRPERMMSYCRRVADQNKATPNVWLGVSVEDQATADARIPLLLQTPAAKRFVSYEPALGPVEFQLDKFEVSILAERRAELDWIIVGGESGPKARPFDLQWARDTVRQCREAGVACFVKQMGARPWDSNCSTCHGKGTYIGWMDGMPGGLPCQCGGCGFELAMKDRAGSDPSEWPEGLRVQEFPQSSFGPGQ